MTTYQVYALASAQVRIGEVEADNQNEAWKKGQAFVREKYGKTVRISDLLDDPTIEELHDVVVED